MILKLKVSIMKMTRKTGKIIDITDMSSKYVLMSLKGESSACTPHTTYVDVDSVKKETFNVSTCFV